MVDVMDNPKAVFRRVGVLTATPRRRRWTEETYPPNSKDGRLDPRGRRGRGSECRPSRWSKL